MFRKLSVSLFSISILATAVFADQNMPIGINVNSSSQLLHDNLKKSELKLQSVKIYWGVDTLAPSMNPDILKRIKIYRDFDMTVTLVLRDKANASKFMQMLRALVKTDEFKMVDRWELGNEWDTPYYWNGSTKEFVEIFSNPAAQIIHDGYNGFHGKVVSGAPAWDPRSIDDLQHYGALDHVDYIGYHGYQTSKNSLAAAFDHIDTVNTKHLPLVITEWICRNPGNWDKQYTDSAGVKHLIYVEVATPNAQQKKLSAEQKSDWRDCSQSFWPVFRDRAYRAYYFKESVTDQMAGRASILKTDFSSKNEPFYSMFKGFDLPASTPPTTGQPEDQADDQSGSGGGNTPSGILSIAAINVRDASTGKILASLVKDQTLSLKALKASNLAFEAVTSFKSSNASVKFTNNFATQKTRIENTAPYAMLGNSSTSGWVGSKLSARSATYDLSAQVFSKKNASGTASKILAIKMKITE